MISRYEVSLDGVDMASLDDRLLITDVSYSPMETETTEQTVADLDGYDLSGVRAKKRTVAVTFQLRIYGTAERNSVCQKVNRWASSGGALRVNDRKGQYLNVRCEEYASIQSVKNWLDPLTLTFASVGNPYWLSDEETTVTLTGKSANGTIRMDGNTGSAFVGLEVTSSGTLTNFKAYVGKTKVILKGISVPSGRKLFIDYVNGRFLRLYADGVSVMRNLQGESTDSLLAPCGEVSSISMEANCRVTAVVRARGMWI